MHKVNLRAESSQSQSESDKQIEEILWRAKSDFYHYNDANAAKAMSHHALHEADRIRNHLYQIKARIQLANLHRLEGNIDETHCYVEEIYSLLNHLTPSKSKYLVQADLAYVEASLLKLGGKFNEMLIKVNWIENFLEQHHVENPFSAWKFIN